MAACGLSVMPAAEKARANEVLTHVGMGPFAGEIFFFPFRRTETARADRARADGSAENHDFGRAAFWRRRSDSA